MQFPTDHLNHPSAKFEWRYLWGLFTHSKRFFHYAEFIKRPSDLDHDIRFRHWSLDGVWGEDDISNLSGFGFKTPDFDLDMCPERSPVEHLTSMVHYYSIPRLVGSSRYNNEIAVGWFDHAWGDVVGSNWDWISIILKDNTYIMVQERLEESLCDITMNNHTERSEFKLEDDNLYIGSLYTHFHMIPLEDEIIFKPKHGRPYSETPIEITSYGHTVGFGMRERTYKPLISSQWRGLDAENYLSKQNSI